MRQQIWKFCGLTNNLYTKKIFAYGSNLHSAWPHFVLYSSLFIQFVRTFADNFHGWSSDVFEKQLFKLNTESFAQMFRDSVDILEDYLFVVF
jgi:hypothetical protein